MSGFFDDNGNVLYHSLPMTVPYLCTVVEYAHGVGNPFAIFVHDVQPLAVLIPHNFVNFFATILQTAVDPCMESFSCIIVCESGQVL